MKSSYYELSLNFHTMNFSMIFQYLVKNLGYNKFFIVFWNNKKIYQDIPYMIGFLKFFIWYEIFLYL